MFIAHNIINCSISNVMWLGAYTLIEHTGVFWEPSKASLLCDFVDLLNDALDVKCHMIRKPTPWPSKTKEAYFQNLSTIYRQNIWCWLFPIDLIWLYFLPIWRDDFPSLIFYLFFSLGITFFIYFGPFYFSYFGLFCCIFPILSFPWYLLFQTVSLPLPFFFFDLFYFSFSLFDWAGQL